MAALRLDAHVHVWAGDEEAAAFPYEGGAPPCPGSTEMVLQAMDHAGICGALIVQPAAHMFDHAYVSASMQRHPGRFAGCLLADPRPESSGVAAMEALAAQGYRAVRFNPYLWPEGQKMDNEVWPWDDCGVHARVPCA